MSATYRRLRKKSWLVTVYSGGQAVAKMVHNEADAKELVRMIHRQELAGINVLEAIRKARASAPVTPSYPTLREALPEWIDSQVRAGEFRRSTVRMYTGAVTRWVFPHVLADGRKLGDVRLDEVTREQLGEVIRLAKEAGRSRALLNCIRNPIKGYYDMLIETKTFPGPNPAGDLKYFLGRGADKRAKATPLAFFAQEEAPALLGTAKAMLPRWHPFIMTGLLAGLRWGESAALFKSDIDWRRGRLHIQRTVSEGQRLEPPKDGEGRWVKASPALLEAPRAHIEAMDLEGQVNRWTPEQRQLVFPNPSGRPMQYTTFLKCVWTPLLAKAGLPYRKYHATRHSYATWLLSDGADLRWVQNQLGHASIMLTADTYGHVQPEKHESAVEGLDRYLA